MVTRSHADSAVASVEPYGESIEHGGASDPALATLLAAAAICAELRALGTVLNYGTGA